MFATFKEKGTIVDGLSQHHELEAEIDDWLKIPDMLPESPLKNRVLQIVSADDLLETMVTVEMTRTILELKVANTEIECAADCGHIHASQRTAPLHELEFELKSGKLSVMRSLAEKLKEHFGLAWSQQTKLAVGMKLQER